MEIQIKGAENNVIAAKKAIENFLNTKETHFIEKIDIEKVDPQKEVETEVEKSERLKAISEQGNWGITTVRSGTGTIENTIEVPLIPATDRGLKFHVAAQELNLISDEFFKLRNHNPEFKNKIRIYTQKGK